MPNNDEITFAVEQRFNALEERVQLMEEKVSAPPANGETETWETSPEGEESSSGTATGRRRHSRQQAEIVPDTTDESTEGGE